MAQATREAESALGIKLNHYARLRQVALHSTASHTSAMRLVVCILFIMVSACARDDAVVQVRPIEHAPEIKDSIALRARYNVATPNIEPVIYVDSIAVHHTRDEQAAVASRDADGHWHVSAVVEEGPGLLKLEQHLVSNDTRPLSDSEGRKLDELLRQADLYREKSQLRDPPGVGGFIHTMEIDTPAGHTVIKWTGRLLGKAGAVADLIIGAG